MLGRLTLLLLLLGVGGADAGSITFDFGAPLTVSTTADQDAALARLLQATNTARAASTPPQAAWTMEEYLRAMLADALGAWKREGAGLNARDACATYVNLTPAQKTQITTALGGKSPCP